MYALYFFKPIMFPEDDEIKQAKQAAEIAKLPVCQIAKLSCSWAWNLPEIAKKHAAEIGQ